MSALSATRIDLTEFKRGYRVLIVCVLGVITSGAVSPLYTFGPFVQPLESAFGWARGEVQTAISFFFVGLVVSSPIAAWQIVRFGMRGAAIISALLLAVGYAAVALINESLWSLYFAYFLLPVLGAGTQFVLWTQLVSLWFVVNRGLALALVLTGTGLCALIVTPLVARVVEWAGWQSGFLFLGSLSLLITLPAVLLLMPRKPPTAAAKGSGSAAAVPAPAQVMSYRSIFASRHFWLITVGLALVVVGILGMITNAVPLMQDNGLDAATAASIFSAVGAALVLGRTVCGYLIDRLWAPGVAFVTLMLPALGCLIFGTVIDNTALLILAAMLVGIGAGAEFDFASFLVARYFGLHNYTRVFAVFYAVASLFTCVTPFIFGRLYDITGSYDAMLWVSGIGFVVGPTLLLGLGRYPREGPDLLARREENSGPVIGSVT